MTFSRSDVKEPGKTDSYVNIAYDNYTLTIATIQYYIPNFLFLSVFNMEQSL